LWLSGTSVRAEGAEKKGSKGKKKKRRRKNVVGVDAVQQKNLVEGVLNGQ